MNIAVCAIGRMENAYAVEFIEHYKRLGVCKFFIYDNNYGDEEHFEDVLRPYIDDGSVEVINYRDLQICQLMAYQDCYDKHGEEYDWICFFDFDEFLDIDDNQRLDEILSREPYKNYDMVHVNWLCYGDNGLVRYDKRPLSARFTTPIQPIDFKKDYNFSENCHIKSIIRGGLENIKWSSTPHTVTNPLNCCNSKGERCDDGLPLVIPFVHDVMRLRHYTTKTIEEFLEKKARRGCPDRSQRYITENDWVGEFFKYNEKTDEKMKFIEDFQEKELMENDNLAIFICTYKQFEPSVSNKAYKILYGNHELGNEWGNGLEIVKAFSDEELDDRFYSEFYMMKNLDENYYKDKKYIGFCHYRKYFDFMDDIPHMDKLFEDCDIIMTEPRAFSYSLREQYGRCHNIEDLDVVENIIKEKYHDYYDDFNIVMDANVLFSCNMFIMRVEDFKEYVSFISGVMDEYIKVVGTDIEKKIEENKEKYLKDYYPNNTVEYQYRIGGYLTERLTDVFVKHKIEKIMVFGMNLTENKY